MGEKLSLLERAQWHDQRAHIPSGFMIKDQDGRCECCGHIPEDCLDHAEVALFYYLAIEEGREIEIDVRMPGDAGYETIE